MSASTLSFFTCLLFLMLNLLSTTFLVSNFSLCCPYEPFYEPSPPIQVAPPSSYDLLRSESQPLLPLYEPFYEPLFQVSPFEDLLRGESQPLLPFYETPFQVAPFDKLLGGESQPPPPFDDPRAGDA